jgi:type I restriction enzyme S subunit
MKDWERYSVAHLISDGVLFIGDGYRAKNEELANHGIPFARVSNINDGFHLEDADRFPEKDLPKVGNKISQYGDVVFTSKGTVGRFAFVRKDIPRFVYSPQLCFWRVLDSQIIDSRFLFFWMFGREFFLQINGVKGQTDMADYVSLADQRKMHITLPPLPEQRAIAEILGAFDDKIELNRRMNATLESMARAVFRQWFVEMEDVGKWEIGKLGDVTENIRRGANPEDIEPNTPYIALEHMPRGSIALSDWGNANGVVSNKFFFKQGEFLFGKLRPYFHKVGIAPLDGVCSTDILVIAPKSSDWYGFVLGHISSIELINYTNAASTGTKMPRTNWSDIARYEVVIPPVKVAKEFNEMFKPMAQQIRANIIQSRTLANLRDTLLPKLMRGEVRVSAL